jgi:hypothetical protein
MPGLATRHWQTAHVGGVTVSQNRTILCALTPRAVLFLG